MLSPASTSSIAVGFQMLRVNPMRTILSTLGVIMGVATLVAVLSLGDGMERFARQRIERTTSLHAIAVVGQSGRTLDGVFVPDSVVPVITAADAAALGALPGASRVELQVNGPALVTREGDTTTRAAQVFGTLAGTAERALDIVHGRYLDTAEARAGARVTVLNLKLATTLARGGSPATLLGQTVRLQGTPFRVIGIGRREGVPLPMAIVPFGAAESAMAPAVRPRMPQLLVLAGRVEDILPLQGAIERWIQASRPEWAGRVTVRSDEARARDVGQGILLFKLFMGALTGISLLVGGIGIMNVLLASVAERTREIGIRKATGARRRDILVQFLCESVAITTAGGALGFALGIGGAIGVTAIMRSVADAPVYAAFSWSTLAVAAISAVLVGLLFGTYPALRAARLSPVEAMARE
ncbi:MAG TPA: ABC transporter permease [Gemmatimonadaceae bacterium]|nr:ABC transporter permease [Gemmatimonadaceae bacterium]